MATPVSPVLPGLVVLAVCILVIPLATFEAMAWRYRRKEPAWQQAKAPRTLQSARVAFAAALAWLVVWFAWGA